MSLWDDIHVRQKIEISIEVLKKVFDFGSTVVRKNDTAVFFPMPSSQSASTIKKNMPCEIIVHVSEDSRLLFNGEISDIQMGTPPIVQINRPPEEKLRRRKSSGAVIRVAVPLTYRIMKDPVTPISDMKKGETTSLGTSDAIIHTNNQVKSGSYIELTITIPGESDPITLVGLVEDSNEVKTGELVSYKSDIKYEVIRPGEQDKIAKYIFAVQMKLRKSGRY